MSPDKSMPLMVLKSIQLNLACGNCTAGKSLTIMTNPAKLTARIDKMKARGWQPTPGYISYITPNELTDYTVVQIPKYEETFKKWSQKLADVTKHNYKCTLRSM